MITVIKINDRGTLTLPRKVRDHLGLSKSGPVVVEDTPDGVMLRSGRGFAPEKYSAKRLKEFERGEAEITPFTDELRAALAKARTKRRK